MELIMLGTGNAMVTRCYNTCFVLSEKDDYFLVDGGGGNGILHQLKHAGIDWKQEAETAFSSSWSKPEFLLQVFVRCL